MEFAGVTIDARSRFHVPMAVVTCCKLTMHRVSHSNFKRLQGSTKRGPKLYVSGAVLQSDCVVPMRCIKAGLHSLARKCTFEHSKSADICQQRNNLSVCNPPGPPLRFASTRGAFFDGPS